MMKTATLRKLLSLLLVLCMALTLFSAVTFADDGEGEEPEAVVTDGVDEPEAESEAEPEPDAESEEEAETEPASEPEEDALTEDEVPAGEEAESEPEAEAEAEPEAEAEAEPEPAVDAEQDAITATFSKDSGVAGIDIYYTNTYEGDPNEIGVSSAYARGSKTGEIDVSGSGQVNFRIRLNEGYSLVDVSASPADNFNKCNAADKIDDSTYIYKVTKVGGDITITITTSKEAVTVTPFVATFNGDAHVASIDSYVANKLSGDPIAVGVSQANALSNKTGEIDISGEGQVNFLIHTDEGYYVKNVTVSGTYNKCNDKGDNFWSITKVGSDLVVNIETTNIPPDFYNFFVDDNGLYNNYGVYIGDSLKITESGDYSLTGVNQTDYAYGRIQIQAEDVSVLLKDVWLTYTNGATINAKFDTTIKVEGDNYLTRVIDAEADPTDDGGKVIKGESGTAGEGVSISIIGDGSLTIDAPKKGIGVDVYMGDSTTYGQDKSDSLAFEQGLDEDGNKTSITLDSTVSIGEKGSETGPTVIINSEHECIEANVINFYSGSGQFFSAGDDGLNVGTDADDSDEDDVDGDENVRERLYPNVDYDYKLLAINFYGGDWYIESADDGVDSNGSVIFEGGDVVVFSSTASDNSPLDAGTENGGEFAANWSTSGSFLAVGNSGMQQMPKGLYIYKTGLSLKGGQKIQVYYGNTLMAEAYVPEAKTGSNCILYSSSDLKEGEIYKIVVDGEVYEVTAKSGNGGSGEGGRQGSQEPETVTITEGSGEDVEVEVRMQVREGAKVSVSVSSEDGKTNLVLKDSDFTLENGKLTIKGSALKDLKAGNYTITVSVEGRSGRVSTMTIPLEVKAKSNQQGSGESNKGSGEPKTGDSSRLSLWAIALLSCTGAVVALMPRRKTN